MHNLFIYRLLSGVLGLFVFCFITWFVLFSSPFANKQLFYTLYAQFSNVDGLSIKSKVLLNGIEIGYIHDISLDEYLSPHVTLHINKNFQNIPTDSFAVVHTYGILQGKSIDILIGADTENFSHLDTFMFTENGVNILRVLNIIKNKMTEKLSTNTY